MKSRSVQKEEEIIKELSWYFCPTEGQKKTLFWLPAPDEIIDQAEEIFSKEGYPSVVPNGDFFVHFPEYWARFNPSDSPKKDSR